MKFEAIEKTTEMLNPLKQMSQRQIPSEIRKDPLTGRTARICHFMKLKWEKPNFDELIKGTDKYCPFCPEKVLKITPCFPEHLLPEGRLIRDDMVLFPNLAPYDCLGAVATMGEAHFIPMTEIKPDRIRESMELAITFFNRIESLNHPEAIYHIVNWNYMPPAGSSIIHPHLQVFSTSSAPNLLRQELSAAQAYMEENQSNFWDDLTTTEKKLDQRYLGNIGRTHWLTAYAPMGVAGDVVAIVSDTSSTLDLNTDDLMDISNGLVNVMRAYDKMGIYSFNMNFFPGKSGDDFTRFHLVFSPRTFFNQSLGATDIGALRNLFNETLCMAFPEEINRMVKAEF